MRRALAVLLVLALVPALAACGGDDEPKKRAKPPELTVPETDPERAPDTATQTAPAPQPTTPATPPGDDGGATAPDQQAPQDSPQNDTPPPPGSEAERYEKFCDQNPGACG